jgi:RNA polymerase sigma-70 factor, ECF subfamily
MSYNERELILQCQVGNTESFGRIYDKHVKTIYNFIYYKVFDKEHAEDLTSQTFFKALKSVASVDPDRPIVSWLYKIAQNSVLDHYRSVRKSEDIDDYWDISTDEDVVSDLDIKVDMERVKKYLKKLSSLERDIIFMRVWQEMPYEEIADIVGKSEANCKMIYSRSLKKLKSMVPLALFLLYFSTIINA